MPTAIGVVSSLAQIAGLMAVGFYTECPHTIAKTMLVLGALGACPIFRWERLSRLGRLVVCLMTTMVGSGIGLSMVITDRSYDHSMFLLGVGLTVVTVFAGNVSLWKILLGRKRRPKGP